MDRRSPGRRNHADPSWSPSPLSPLRRGEPFTSISTGIVVLIMALLGAAMWVTFSGIMEDTGENVEQEIGEIGQ